MRFTVETVSFLMHTGKQFDQLPFTVHLFTTGKEQQIRLFARTTIVKGTVTARVIATLCPTGDSRVTMVTKTIPHLQLVAIGPHKMKTSHAEENWIPVNIVKR